ncbi:hypothetical protein OSB04_002387 [Centaurea solstitialis]|uniref:Reverse transcriptase/retrotransposon-derived protein RNase H-like domain-containing protein n=1 Tax=Centaurea solstitialis TaxID=347529 RepID=A0AA38WVB1_9ASTR|nr:hypothetical protein OSB04_002387 [Centaurea solstitialis]
MRPPIQIPQNQFNAPILPHNNFHLQPNTTRQNDLSTYNFAHTPKELVNSLRNVEANIRWPKKYDQPGKAKNQTKWYDFHDDHGHTTEDCISLRMKVAYHKPKGHLKNIFPGELPSNDRLPLPVHTKVVNCITGGLEIGSLTNSATKRHDDLDEPNQKHHDNLVIQLTIGNCLKRILVDGDGSANDSTDDHEQALQNLKSYMMSPPLLTKPEPGEDLQLYLAVSSTAVSAVMVREKDKLQRPIYYVSESLLDAETRGQKPHQLDHDKAITSLHYVKISSGIKLITSTPRYPQANGLAKSSNKSIINTIRKKFNAAKGKWVEEHPEVYRPIEELRNSASLKMTSQKSTVERYFNKNMKDKILQVRDYVLRRVFQNTQEINACKISIKWEGSYQITQVIADGPYKLKAMDGKEIEIPRSWNATHLKRYRTIDNRTTNPESDVARQSELLKYTITPVCRTIICR